MAGTGTTRLRGTTLLAAPIFMVGIIGCSLALATGLWGAWNSAELGPVFWATLVVSASLGLGAFTAGQGCFIEVDDDEVRDVVAWWTVRRLDRRGIVTARVRAGAWRWFEVEMADSSRHLLVGAAPTQFPARLFDGSRARDVADLDLLLGDS